MTDYGTLEREDYYEPRCIICDPQTGLQSNSMSQIPIQRIIEKMDEYCERKDFAGAERHLKYWLEEARYIHDMRGEFSMRNEMMGFYRKQGRKDEAVENANAALDLMALLNIGDSLSAGTCYVNCGTVYDSFAMPGEALGYFENAQEIYETLPHKDHHKLGGLYNNMALTLADLERFDDAMNYYGKALETMKDVEGGEADMAITYLNMADAAAMRDGIDGASEDISRYINEAYRLLCSENVPHDGYYAFVCEKCAPGFNCYGYFDLGEEIASRSEKIYAELAEA